MLFQFSLKYRIVTQKFASQLSRKGKKNLRCTVAYVIKLTRLHSDGRLLPFLANIIIGQKWLTCTNTLAYYRAVLITDKKSFVILVAGACTIKHYGFLLHVLSSKLVCLTKPGRVTDNNKKIWACYAICPFSLHYESVMFYSKKTCSLCYKNILMIVNDDCKWSLYYKCFIRP